MYSDGYKYWLAYKKNKTSYYRCSRYKTMCPGRCVVEDAKIRNCTEHNHPPEPDRMLVDNFRKILTQRASVETTDLYTIYWEEASQRHSDAALLYTFTAAESAMRKARRKQLPQLPDNISDLGKILDKTNLFRIHSGSKRDAFYQATLTLEDSTCVIFAHFKTIEAIGGHIEELHINEVLDVELLIPLPSYQLLIVHAVQSYYSVPIVYAILTTKTQSAYAAIFAYIRENLAAFIKPNTIMANYDSNVQLSLAYTFPEASIKGYWSQYTDAILKYMQSIGFHWDKTRGHTSSCLRMLMVLPLLPAEYMVPGLQAIRKWAREKGILVQTLEQLCMYIEQNWLRSIGVDKMSVFGLPHSVYNHRQHFNKELQSSLATSQPSVWHLLECITHIATRNYIKCNKRQRAAMLKPNKNQKVLDTIIKNATQMWIRTPIHLRNPLQFLQLTSHCINDTNYYSGFDCSDTKTKLFKTFSNAPVATPSLVIVSKSSSPFSATSTQSISSPYSSVITKTSSFVARSGTSTLTSPVQCSSSTPPSLVLSTVTIPSPTYSNCNLPVPSECEIGSRNQTDQCDNSSIKKIICNNVGVAAVNSWRKLTLTYSSLDPPPLAFYPKSIRKSQQKPIMFSTTEPPPLVPIQRHFA